MQALGASIASASDRVQLYYAALQNGLDEAVVCGPLSALLVDGRCIGPCRTRLDSRIGRRRALCLGKVARCRNPSALLCSTQLQLFAEDVA